MLIDVLGRPAISRKTWEVAVRGIRNAHVNIALICIIQTRP